MENYKSRFEEQMDRHKVEEPLDRLEEGARTYPASKETMEALENLDKQTKEIQITSEAKCRTVCLGSTK